MEPVLPTPLVDPGRTALLIIDMQNDFVDERGVLPVPGIRRILPQIQVLSDACRRRDIPVIYTVLVHDDTYNLNPLTRVRFPSLQQSGLRPGSWGVEVCPELAPQPRDIIVRKRRHSAFYGTDLEIYLRNLRGRDAIDTLVITGTTTNVCVESTVRDAFARDYKVLLVADACCAFDEHLHAATLDNVRYIYGWVVTTQQVLDALASSA